MWTVNDKEEISCQSLRNRREKEEDFQAIMKVTFMRSLTWCVVSDVSPVGAIFATAIDASSAVSTRAAEQNKKKVSRLGREKFARRDLKT